MYLAFDADQDCSKVAPKAKTAGCIAIFRYLKNLTDSEVTAIHAAGLKIVSIFESSAERALQGAAAGTEDGMTALDQASALGQPQGSAIYATADFGETAHEDPAVLAYFTAFKAGLQGQGKLGVYGEGAVCKLCKDANVVDYTWIAGGRGMRGTLAFEGQATVEQDVGDKRNLHLGISIDSDVIYSEDFGGW